MALTTWHYGKLIILWVWGAILTALSWYVAIGLEPARDDAATSIAGLVALALMFAIPASLSVVTWKWLGGREKVAEEQPGSADSE